MSIDQELLEILACPLCKTEVRLTEDKQWLQCVTCRRKYPIEDDIPIMLVQRAVLDNESETSEPSPVEE